jgi:hypothetical protein
LWHIVQNKQSKDALIQAIIANECGYDDEESVWTDMEWDMSNEKQGGKTRAWYAFWRAES